MQTEAQLLSIATQIITLKKFQKETGVNTTRSQGSFIRTLNPQELVAVARLVNEALGVK
jgi:hypothetical protein